MDQVATQSETAVRLVVARQRKGDDTVASRQAWRIEFCWSGRITNERDTTASGVEFELRFWKREEVTASQMHMGMNQLLDETKKRKFHVGEVHVKLSGTQVPFWANWGCPPGSLYQSGRQPRTCHMNRGLLTKHLQVPYPR